MGEAGDIHILQPTSLRRERSDPWGLHVEVSGDMVSFVQQSPTGEWTLTGERRTDNERDHGGTISAGGFETLDQLLDLPDLNVLLGFTTLALLLGTHGGRGEGDPGRGESIRGLAYRRLTGVKIGKPEVTKAGVLTPE